MGYPSLTQSDQLLPSYQSPKLSVPEEAASVLDKDVPTSSYLTIATQHAPLDSTHIQLRLYAGSLLILQGYQPAGTT